MWIHRKCVLAYAQSHSKDIGKASEPVKGDRSTKLSMKTIGPTTPLWLAEEDARGDGESGEGGYDMKGWCEGRKADPYCRISCRI